MDEKAPQRGTGTDAAAAEEAALVRVRPLVAAWPLLAGLVGGSPRDFLARAAVIEVLAAPEPREEALTWLAEPARSGLLAELRGSGWLEPEPATPPALTPIGRLGHAALALLRRRLRAAAPAAPRPAAGQSERLAALRRRLLAILATLGGSASMGRLAQLTEEPAARLRRALRELEAAGRLRRTGERSSTRYHLVPGP